MPPGPKKRRAAKRKKEKEKEKEKEKVTIHHHLPNSPTTPLLSPRGNGHHDLIVHEACNGIEGEVEEIMKNSETAGEKAEPEMTQKPETAEEAVTTAAAEEAKVVNKAPDVPSPGSETRAAASEADVSVPIEQAVEVIEEAIQGRKDILSAVAEEVSVLAAPTSREREVKVVPIADEPEETAPTSEDGSVEASSATTARPRGPIVVDRATWWKCCGLFDVFASSGR